jgi:hypothetical protein
MANFRTSPGRDIVKSASCADMRMIDVARAVLSLDNFRVLESQFE